MQITRHTARIANMQMYLNLHTESPTNDRIASGYLCSTEKNRSYSETVI